MDDVGTVTQAKMGIYYHNNYQRRGLPSWIFLGRQMALDLRPLKWNTWFLTALVQVSYTPTDLTF